LPPFAGVFPGISKQVSQNDTHKAGIGVREKAILDGHPHPPLRLSSREFFDRQPCHITQVKPFQIHFLKRYFG
jgi:hypothetical protein